MPEVFFPCEIVLKRFSPAVKAEATKLLSEKYSLTQVQIAGALGITQAAVSKYLAGKYSKEIRVAAELPSVKKTASKLAESIALRKPFIAYTSEYVCSCCREMRARGFSFGSLASGGLHISEKCDLK